MPVETSVEKHLLLARAYVQLHSSDVLLLVVLVVLVVLMQH